MPPEEVVKTKAELKARHEATVMISIGILCAIVILVVYLVEGLFSQIGPDKKEKLY